MSLRSFALLAALSVQCSGNLSGSDLPAAEPARWAQWRGPHGNGISDEKIRR